MVGRNSEIEGSDDELSIAAIGDVADITCWSGIPYHFWKAALRRGLHARAIRLDMREFAWSRRLWNARQLLCGHSARGYQYSRSFLRRAEDRMAKDWNGGRIITFNQHFPRTSTICALGGSLWHYLDATFASLCEPGGAGENLPLRIRKKGIELECENYAGGHIVMMARWAAESVVNDCGVPAKKVATILPGANVDLPPDYSFPFDERVPGKERPLVLGFVGKDWQRKGLPFLLQVRNELERMGFPAVVRAAGHCPKELRRTAGLEFVGFIDKAVAPGTFLEFLASCDLGCLFSEREPLGISTLEFLRAGVPVAGFAIEGLADTLPPDAGFRFPPASPACDVAETLRIVFTDHNAVARLRGRARYWSERVTWERCVGEWVELLTTGKIANPVRPWL